MRLENPSTLTSTPRPRGSLWIALASILWATDALVRYPAVSSLDPAVIVLVEHVFGTAVLLVWVLWRERARVLDLGPKQWISAALVGVGGSALATVLFTASFRYVNPSLSILLQKLQPILAISLAYLVLGEKPGRRFLGWAAVAILAAAVMSYPALTSGSLPGQLDLHSRGVLYALAAAALWASATVGGKILTRRCPVVVTTFWRYVFGLLSLVLLVAVGRVHPPLGELARIQVLGPLIYMSLVPGIAALLFYYSGLSTTPASVATLIELIFPVTAVILNTLVLGMPLEPLQLGAGAVLIMAVARISLLANSARATPPYS